MLIADVTEETRHRALAKGVTDFVTKPIDITEVLLRTRNLLLTRHLYGKLERHNKELEEKVRERTQELSGTQLEMLAHSRSPAMNIKGSGVFSGPFEPYCSHGARLKLRCILAMPSHARWALSPTSIGLFSR